MFKDVTVPLLSLCGMHVLLLRGMDRLGNKQICIVRSLETLKVVNILPHNHSIHVSFDFDVTVVTILIHKNTNKVNNLSGHAIDQIYHKFQA